MLITLHQLRLQTGKSKCTAILGSDLLKKCKTYRWHSMNEALIRVCLPFCCVSPKNECTTACIWTHISCIWDCLVLASKSVDPDVRDSSCPGKLSQAAVRSQDLNGQSALCLAVRKNCYAQKKQIHASCSFSRILTKRVVAVRKICFLAQFRWPDMLSRAIFTARHVVWQVCFARSSFS